ncbi:MAG: hypothetical protein N4A63_02625 [Vallitalea sp.]|jgi:hypothetical protein|nr:hypothetical protein [Vallitalea sp.]
MKLKHYLEVLVVLLIITGCSSNKIDSKYENIISDLKNQIRINKDNNEKLTNLLDSQISRNKQLENEISILKKDLTAERKKNQKFKENTDEKKNRWDYELQIFSARDNKLSYFIEEKNNMYQTINIIGSDNNFKSETYDFETINISGTGSNEFVKVIVFGSIYSFELLEIIWDDNLESSDYRVLESIDFVRNKEIVIETTLPEGLPGEMIRWKDEEGNTYEQYLKYDGIGISGILILPK